MVRALGWIAMAVALTVGCGGEDANGSGAPAGETCPSAEGAPCCVAPEIICPPGYAKRVSTFDNGEVSYAGCLNARNDGTGPFAEYDRDGHLIRFGEWGTLHSQCEPGAKWASWQAEVSVAGGRARAVCTTGCWDVAGVGADCAIFETGVAPCDGPE